MTDPDLQPTLRGERVVLRPLVADDFEALHAVASDPRVWAQHPVRDRHREPVFRRFFEGALASGGALTILDRATDRVIGSSRYHGHDPPRSEVEIGWTFLAVGCWGGAFNRDVKRQMLRHAFSFADTVVFWVAVENHRSRRAMQKIGGALRDGVRTRASSGDTPYVVFEISRASFVAGPLARGNGSDG